MSPQVRRALCPVVSALCRVCRRLGTRYICALAFSAAYKDLPLDEGDGSAGNCARGDRPARPEGDAAYLQQVLSPRGRARAGLPACSDGVRRLSGVPHSAEGLLGFDALFNSHYVSP